MSARDGVVYKLGSITIQPFSRTAEREGELLPLSARAFDALLLLVERQGQTVSKAELMAAIWADTHVDESSLPVMISSIRRAIGDDGRSQKMIQTVSKAGYRLVGEVKVVHPQLPRAPFLQNQSHFSAAARFALAVFAAILLPGSVNTGGERSPVHPHVAKEVETSYQKGRYAWNLQTKSGILQSIDYYRKAITDDPGYAAAWAGLAEAYVSLPSYSERANDAAYAQARVAAARALALNDQLADAHIAAGMVELIGDHNPAGGESELRRAIALNPSSPLAEGELALCLVSAGRTAEAVTHARRAKALDPLSIRAATDLGIVFYYGHRFPEAQAEFEEVLRLDPYSYRAHINLGKTYLCLGRFDDALRVFGQASSLSNHDPLAEGLTAQARALRGDRKGAQLILAQLERRERSAYVAPISLAFAYAGLGRIDETLINLKKAHRDRTIAAVFLKVDPNWDTLHDNKDFQDLVKDLPDTEPQEETYAAGK